MFSWFTDIDWKPEAITAAATVTLACLTLVLSAGIVFLWLATRRLVVGGENNAERQLRAYLAIKPRNAVNVYPELIGRADFIIENTGQTPAYNVRYVAMFDILEHPLVDHQGDLIEPEPGEKIPTQAIHSHAHTIGSARADRAMTFDEWAQITNGSHRVYLAGAVFYTDVFGIERKTKFAAFIGGPEYQRLATIAFTTKTNPTTMDWSYSHVHNEAT